MHVQPTLTEIPGRFGQVGRPVFPAGWRLLAGLCCLLAALGGCAGKSAREPAPQPTGFASADAKNLHDFILRYPEIATGDDAKAYLRLFTDDARVVPLLGNAVRPIRPNELDKQLPQVLAEEHRLGLHLVWREPMDIQVKGERASVRVVGELRWHQSGQARQAVMSCYFGLIRDEHYLWKIKEFHGEPVGPDYRLPPPGTPTKPLPPRDATLKSRKTKRVIKGEPEKKPQPAPATAPAPQPQPQPEAAPPPPADGAIVPMGETPKPLF